MTRRLAAIESKKIARQRSLADHFDSRTALLPKSPWPSALEFRISGSLCQNGVFRPLQTALSSWGPHAIAW